MARRDISYSKYPDFAGIASDFFRNMMMVKQYRQGQEEQRYQRGITERQLDLQRQRLEQEKPPTQAQIKWSMADANVASGAWTPEQGQAYKMTGKMPTPRVKYPATTAANVKSLFKITDEEWKNLPTVQKGQYFKEYMLRKRPRAGKEALTPEQEQIQATFGKHTGLIKGTGKRLQQYEKELMAKIKVPTYRRKGLFIKPGEGKQVRDLERQGFGTQEALMRIRGIVAPEQELANVQELMEGLRRMTASSIASKRPLMPEYASALNKLMRASPEDIKSGRFLQTMKEEFVKSIEQRQPPGEQPGAFQVGRTYEDKDGNKAVYRGVDANGKPIWESVR